MAYAIGMDFGTNSARALVVRCRDGGEVGEAVFGYPSGEAGILLDPQDDLLARQHPPDYLEALAACLPEALAAAEKADAEFSREKVIGVGIDTTGSSPMPVDERNRPLGGRREWKDRLEAQCWLWKDHTSSEEALAITEIAREGWLQYVAKCGGVYSSEWFWSKIWHCLKTAPDVFDAAASWVEISDWIPSALAGVEDPAKIRRGVCAAGHKALYAEDWGGLPEKAFLERLDPKMADLRDRLYEKAYDASHGAGRLSFDWAERLGLPEGIPIGIGAFDVHYGAIGAAVEEGTLVKVIGTSTCDCAVASASSEVADVPGICGIVKGSILPGYYGIEAGQSAVGDLFAWWTNRVCEGADGIHERLTREADKLAPGESGLLALDWNNGNRTVLVDPRLTGLLVGQTLRTSRAEIYRALIEATAFGARAILERLEEYGIPVERIVCAGGVAEKNPLLMQIYADVTGREMRLARSGQCCALGSAIVASVAAGEKAGGHADFDAARAAMAGIKDKVYAPRPEASAVYERLYHLYMKLHDAFGGVGQRDLGSLMKELLKIKADARRA